MSNKNTFYNNINEKLNLVFDLQNIVDIFEIKFKNYHEKERFFRKGQNLITIMFAVILGVGLSHLSDFSITTLNFLKNINFWIFVLAYLAVILSWFGYHLGIISGPLVTNILNYTIDIFLIFVYWFLINICSSKNFTWIFYLLMVMFFLYYIWEGIRSNKKGIDEKLKEKINKARKINLKYFIILFFLFIFYKKLFLIQFLNDMSILKYTYLLIFFVILIYYRIEIGKIYKVKKKKEENINKKSNEKNLEGNYKKIIEKAKEASNRANAKLSKFPVGAAIYTQSKKIFKGCNIEFDNYSNTLHAEEVALSSMILSGAKNPISIAIYIPGDEKLPFPCGMCRQSLFELGGKDLEVIACNDEKCEKKKMRDLFPDGFNLK